MDRFGQSALRPTAERRPRARAHRRHVARRAFSLLEMLAVLAIIGLLVALVAPRLGTAFGGGQVKAAKAQLAQLTVAVNQFRLDMGRLPTAEEGLTVLVDKPDDAGEKWQGYLDKREVPVDPWGTPYVYKLDDEFGFEILSLGADKAEGGEGANADLSNRE